MLSACIPKIPSAELHELSESKRNGRVLPFMCWTPGWDFFLCSLLVDRRLVTGKTLSFSWTEPSNALQLTNEGSECWIQRQWGVGGCDKPGNVCFPPFFSSSSVFKHNTGPAAWVDRGVIVMLVYVWCMCVWGVLAERKRDSEPHW